MREMTCVQDTRAVMFVQNFEQSIGNYVVDADGNKMLDAFNQISSLAMGYNNPALLKAAQSPQVARCAHASSATQGVHVSNLAAVRWSTDRPWERRPLRIGQTCCLAR